LLFDAATLKDDVWILAVSIIFLQKHCALSKNMESAGYKNELPPNQRKETSMFKIFKNTLIAQSDNAMLILTLL
jgi:hypothetical protein